VAQLRFKLSGPAQRVRVRIYLPSMVLASHSEHEAAFQAGWNSASLDLQGLPAGLFYAVLEAEDGRRQSLPRPPMRLYRLR
jgi:hypothetical protein